MTSLANLQRNFKYLSLTGTIDVQKVDRSSGWAPNALKILIMGPTGAGKSSFIEALAGPHSSVNNLSSSQLEGYTQHVSSYEVKGIEWRSSPVYLIDTPGFADEKISALEIVNEVQRLMKDNSDETVGLVLYFTPITVTRLPASQRAVLKLCKAVTGLQSAGGLTIVTTMWDTLWSEKSRERAKSNLEQLTNGVWKDFISQRSKITKFHNTQPSALEILNLAVGRTRYDFFHIEHAIMDGTKHSETMFGDIMYEDLISRVQSLRLRKRDLISDTANLTNSDDAETKAILDSELEGVNGLLAKFEQQLVGFDSMAHPSDSHLSSATSTLPNPSQSSEPGPHLDRAADGPPDINPMIRIGRMKDYTKRWVGRVARRPS